MHFVGMFFFANDNAVTTIVKQITATKGTATFYKNWANRTKYCKNIDNNCCNRIIAIYSSKDISRRALCRKIYSNNLNTIYIVQYNYFK